MLVSRTRLAVAAAAIATVMGWCRPAAAHDLDPGIQSVFLACDGHPAPTEKTDGLMTDRGGFLGSPKYGPTHRSGAVVLGSYGADACDKALADPILKPEFWQRKVSLLRARAMHHLGAGDTKSAFADLDAAEAAASDPNFLYQRSLKLGIDMVRALGLRQSGRQAEAEALAMKAWASRPYERHVIISAMIAIGPKGDARALDTLRRALAKVEPEGLTQVYDADLDAGRFEEAMAMREELVPAQGKNSGGFHDEEVRQDSQNHYLWEMFWVVRSGERAYVLATQGKAEAARAELAAAQAHLDGQQPPAGGTQFFSGKPLAPEAAWVQADDRLKTDGSAELRRWGALVDLRLMVAGGQAEAAAARFDPRSLELNGATIELLRSMAAALPKDARLPADPDEAARLLADRRAAGFPATVDYLFRWLPDADGWPVLPQYHPLAEYTWNWRRGISLNGFTADPGSPEDSGGVIRFHGASSSPMDVEEMALLRAADMARRLHKGLIVEKAADRLHVETKLMYGREIGRSEDGYEAEIEVLFVDPANLPEKFRGTPWRVLDAEAVYAALRPSYPSKD